MPRFSARQATVLAILLILTLSGCATTTEKKANVTVPEGYQARTVKFKDAIGKGIIFEPIFYSKLDILKENATIKNNRLTAEVAAGTAAAVIAYTATANAFNTKKAGGTGVPPLLMQMAASAGSAYAAAAFAGAIYDMFVPEKKRY